MPTFLRRGGVALLSLALHLALGTSFTQAETLSFGGTDFPVDSIQQTTPDQLTVEVAGERFLALRANAPRQVARAYARHPELARKLSWSTYGSFVSAMASSQEHEISQQAIQGVLSSAKLNNEEVIQFIQALSKTEVGEKELLGELLRAETQGQYQEAAICSALSFLSSSSQAVVRTKLAEGSGVMRDGCPQQLLDRAREAIAKDDLAQGESMLRAVVGIFGSQSEGAKTATLTIGRLEAINTATQESSAEKFESALRAASIDPLLVGEFGRLQPQFVATFARRALQQQRPGSALSGLANLDFSQRSSQHHELVTRALRDLQFKDSPVLQNERVSKMLWSYATKDESIRQQYVSLLDGFLSECVDGNDPQRGVQILNLVKEIRLDPSAENDSLRIQLAKKFAELGESSRSQEMVSGMSTSVPLLFRLRMIVIQNPLVGLAGIAFLFCISIFGLRKRRSKRTSSEAQKPEPEQQEFASFERRETASNEEDTTSKFSNHNMPKTTYSDFDEYGTCLNKFNLTIGATAAEIKVAYRNMVKACHPDLNPRASRADTDKFIELTKTYERLLVLHEQRESQRE